MHQTERDAIAALREAAPGERFRAYYRAAHGAGTSRGRNALLTVLGVLVLIVGIVAVPAPGPGFLILAVGGGLVARQSARVAGWLDRAEVALREFVAHAIRAWHAASLLERGLFVLVVAAGALVAGYWMLFWLLRG